MTHAVRADRPAAGVLRLSLDRPEQRNAIDGAVVGLLTDHLTEPDADVVILGSTDARAFCAGADTGLADADRARVSDDLYALYQLMIELPTPIIAAARGHAVGGGAQLLLASDVRIAGPDLQVRLVGPGHGLAVGAWGLPSLVGRGRALELCLSLRPVTAEEALRIGLVEQVVDDPDAAALDLAVHISGLETEAVRRLKRITVDAAGMRDALARERADNRQGWSGSLGPRPAASST